MFVIAEIAGTQEKLTEGESFRVPTLDVKEGDKVDIDKILLVSKGDDVKVGNPYITGASAKATVVAHGRDKKIRVFKMKRRKRYRKVQGHRQGYTDIKIDKITV
ncbi:MAG: 50S ribosomal protein L21 [Candidatus Peribacteraceae bacterium]|nr:50S ribosomal protein L21 [Candidatus Peribacteraceae bacterium]